MARVTINRFSGQREHKTVLADGEVFVVSAGNEGTVAIRIKGTDDAGLNIHLDAATVRAVIKASEALAVETILEGPWERYKP
jgi:hypothetical protein